ncbi:hypothetical protein FLK61_37205 [Paenalkalicoccus suaedae]|uniref:PDZ domain-containing protein n=1 Tax=Paenalkalicoccus suaedae TaxID=2592382 RepID=A0A859FGP3_9BACI|nr:PDZ domain-containing protein [Paenalkalicoccus suaedae]QKS72277.1 hypothetical protein FLK61_37205 [Paenalkalicoccus suaedae]
MEVIALEVLRAIGRLFIHPLTYIFILAAFLLHIKRVKIERRDFHTRAVDVISGVLSPVPKGLLAALIVSTIVILAGIQLPFAIAPLFTLIWLIQFAFRNAAFYSVTITGAVAILITPFLPNGGTDIAIVDAWLAQLAAMDLAHLTYFVVLLFVTEVFLLLIDGATSPSPRIVKSRRGKMVGQQVAQRIWFLPVLLLFPVGDIANAGYWPALAIGTSITFGLVLFPFVLGIQVPISSELPKAGVKTLARRQLLIAVLVIATAALSVVSSIFLFATAAILLVGRLFTYVQFARRESQHTSIFNTREQGLVIVGIIPHSIADKSNLEVGDIVLKANGAPVATQRELYEALQLNSAFVKLEILGTDGQIRFAQSSVHQGAHYQLGCLFVPDDEAGNLSLRGLRSSVVVHKDRTELSTGTTTQPEPLESTSQNDVTTEHQNSPADKSQQVAEEAEAATTLEEPTSNTALETDSSVAKEENQSDNERIEANEETLLIEGSDSDTKLLEDTKPEPKRIEEVSSADSESNSTQEESAPAEDSQKEEAKPEADSNKQKDAHEKGLPYGQAAGLSSFYEEFKKGKSD